MFIIAIFLVDMTKHPKTIEGSQFEGLVHQVGREDAAAGHIIAALDST